MLIPLLNAGQPTSISAHLLIREEVPCLLGTNTQKIFRTRITAERRGFVFIHDNLRLSVSYFPISPPEGDRPIPIKSSCRGTSSLDPDHRPQDYATVRNLLNRVTELRIDTCRVTTIMGSKPVQISGKARLLLWGCLTNGAKVCSKRVYIIRWGLSGQQMGKLD